MKIYLRALYIFLGGLLTIFPGYQLFFLLSRFANYGTKGILGYSNDVNHPFLSTILPYSLMVTAGLIYLVFGFGILISNKFSNIAVVISAMFIIFSFFILNNAQGQGAGSMGAAFLVMGLGIVSILASSIFLFIALCIAIKEKM